MKLPVMEETMSLGDIEKALHAHFTKKASNQVNNLQSVIKSTKSLAEQKINRLTHYYV